MAYCTEPETHKAKKAHRCEWCWQRIEIGEQYMRYRFYDGGEAGTVKAHPECYDAIQELAREEGGSAEWTPGQERPATKQAASLHSDTAHVEGDKQGGKP